MIRWRTGILASHTTVSRTHPVAGHEVASTASSQRTGDRRTQRRGNVIRRRTGILASHTTVTRCHPVAGHEVASTASSQRTWLRITVDLALRVRRPRSVTLVDRKLSTRVRDVVVIQRTGDRRTQRCSNVIRPRTGILASYTTVTRTHPVAGHEVASTASSQRTWLCVAVGLAVRGGRPRRITLVDGELGARIGDVVVVQRTRDGRTQRGGNVIRRRTGILASHTTVTRCHSVAGHEIASTASSQRTWLPIAVGLAVRVGRPRSVTLVDRELGA